MAPEHERGDPADDTDKLAFLQDPAAYPEQTTHVELVETHMSWVLLLDARVYKLKKPVRRPPLLDLSSAAARRRNCEAEVRLNRRLAPQIYLGVVPLTRHRSRLALGGHGREIDWLVKMRRLPAERMLDHLIATDAVGEGDLASLTLRLSRFYARQVPLPLSWPVMRDRMHREIKASEGALGRYPDELDGERVTALTKAQQQFLDQAAALFQDRLTRGRVLEGHGDLRPEHVCLTEPPAVIDCLEFSRELRTLDSADELAFLAVECEYLDAGGVGDALLRLYRRHSGDAPEPALVAFYKAFRACLRARLAVLHLQGVMTTSPERARWLGRASRYLDLAEHHSGAFA